MRQIDLHVHSDCSDGTLSPARLVDYAMEKNLSAFALTDHDTTEGIAAARQRAEELRHTLPPKDAALVPEVIAGIEFSTEYQGRDIHIVGLDFDDKNPSFAAQQKLFAQSRTSRNLKMCRLLQDAGIDITYEALLNAFPGAVITRAHYARYLFDHGYVGSLREAFDRYVGDHSPCFVPREKVTPLQAVALILETGGIPILAHPILYHMSDEGLEQLTALLTEGGLIGIEAIYSTYKPHEEREIVRLAKRHGLCISGGSDFHGDNKPGLDLGCGYGKLFVPYSVLERLRSRRREI